MGHLDRRPSRHSRPPRALLPSTPTIRVLTVLGVAMFAHGQVALAEIDSIAARNAPLPDPALRWQFDTGG